MTTVKESYADHVTALKELGPALSAALAVQYEAPPGGTGGGADSHSRGVRNPTLEVVLDPRRMAVSDEISAAARSLRAASALLRPHIAALQTAVAAWEGQEGPK